MRKVEKHVSREKAISKTIVNSYIPWEFTMVLLIALEPGDHKPFQVSWSK